MVTCTILLLIILLSLMILPILDEKAWYKIMLGLIKNLKKLFLELLTVTVYASNHIKCVSLNDNQQCMVQPTLITFVS